MTGLFAHYSSVIVTRDACLHHSLLAGSHSHFTLHSSLLTTHFSLIISTKFLLFNFLQIAMFISFIALSIILKSFSKISRTSLRGRPDFTQKSTASSRAAEIFISKPSLYISGGSSSRNLALKGSSSGYIPCKDEGGY